MISMNKKGQVTIFIILGIIVVAVAVLIYLLYPQIKSTFFKTTNPQGFIQTCMGDKIKETINTLSLQGGSMKPENYFTYNGIKIEYLCYINGPNLQGEPNCVVQQPLLQAHIKNEIEKEINQAANSCFNDLVQNYQKQGYSVNLIKGESIVDILPKRILVTFNNQFTATKGNSQRYEKFSVLVNNNLYELLAIANSIVNWEFTYGGSDPMTYMIFYPNLKVELNLRADETKIYTLTERDSGDKFQFAIRSSVPPILY